MMKFYNSISSRKNLKLPVSIERIPVQRNHYHLIHYALHKYDILSSLPSKCGDLKPKLATQVLLLKDCLFWLLFFFFLFGFFKYFFSQLDELGVPESHDRALTLLGFVDCEKIAAQIRNLENGIVRFFRFVRFVYEFELSFVTLFFII